MTSSPSQTHKTSPAQLEASTHAMQSMESRRVRLVELVGRLVAHRWLRSESSTNPVPDDVNVLTSVSEAE